MPKHVADALEDNIVAALKEDPAFERAFRRAIRHHVERIAAKNGCLQMALNAALLDHTHE